MISIKERRVQCDSWFQSRVTSLLGLGWGRQFIKVKVHEGTKQFTSHWPGSKETVFAFITKPSSKKPFSYYFVNGLIFHWTQSTCDRSTDIKQGYLFGPWFGESVGTWWAQEWGHKQRQCFLLFQSLLIASISEVKSKPYESHLLLV